MLQLASFLHSVAGFSITIAHTRFNSPNPSNFPHFQFVYLDDGIPEKEAIPTDLIAVLLELNVNCRDSFKAEMRKLMAVEPEDSSEVIAGVIHDEIMFFCEEIASDLKLRSFILRTTAAVTSLARMALVSLNDEGMVIYFKFPIRK